MGSVPATYYAFQDLLITGELLPQLIWESLTPAEQQKRLDLQAESQRLREGDKPLHDMTEELMIIYDTPAILRGLGNAGYGLSKGEIGRAHV